MQQYKDNELKIRTQASTLLNQQQTTQSHLQPSQEFVSSISTQSSLPTNPDLNQPIPTDQFLNNTNVQTQQPQSMSVDFSM